MAANPLAASDLRRYASDTFAASGAPPPQNDDTPAKPTTAPSAAPAASSATAVNVQRPTPQRFLSADAAQVARPIGANMTPSVTPSTGASPTPGSLSSAAQSIASTVTRPTAMSAPATPSDAAAQAELAKTMTDLNNPSNPQSPLYRPPTAAGAPAAASVTRPVFGDVNAASSTTGGTPRVIDDSNVADVLKNHSAAAYSAPSANNDAAVANLMSRTPTLEQGADQIARNQAVLSRDVGFNQDPAHLAQQQAQSNLAAIAVKDPRSVAGIAARNAAVDAGSGFGTRAGRAIAYDGMLKGLVNQASSPVAAAALAAQEAGNTQREAMRQAGDTTRTTINSQAQMYGADSRGDAARDVAGTRGDAARDVAGTRGDAARDVARTRASVPRVNQAETKLFHSSYQHAFDSLTQGGMSPEDAAAQAAQFGTSAVLGYRNIKTPNDDDESERPQPPTQMPAPKPGYFDIQYLKNNPQSRALFDARFGKGASNLHLGNG